MISFVTNAEFLTRYDGRWTGKNVLDTGTAANVAELSDSTSPGGLVLKAMLEEASEYVMAAAAVGARYSPTDLYPNPLATPPYPGGGSLLIRIVCDIAMGLILKRRGRAVSDYKALSASYDEAMDYIEQLRRGERIFPFVPDVPEAGLPTTSSTNPILGVDPPLLTQQAARYFGHPIGGGYSPYWPYFYG